MNSNDTNNRILPNTVVENSGSSSNTSPPSSMMMTKKSKVDVTNSTKGTTSYWNKTNNNNNNKDSIINNTNKKKRIKRIGSKNSTNNNDGSNNKNGATSNTTTTTSSLMKNRFEELLVLQLHKDGSKRYLQLSTRALYDYVIYAITKRNSNNNQYYPPLDQQNQNQQQHYTSSTAKNNGNTNNNRRYSNDYSNNTQQQQQQQQYDHLNHHNQQQQRQSSHNKINRRYSNDYYNSYQQQQQQQEASNNSIPESPHVKNNNKEKISYSQSTGNQLEQVLLTSYSSSELTTTLNKMDDADYTNQQPKNDYPQRKQPIQAINLNENPQGIQQSNTTRRTYQQQQQQQSNNNNNNSYSSSYSPLPAIPQSPNSKYRTNRKGSIGYTGSSPNKNLRISFQNQQQKNDHPLHFTSPTEKSGDDDGIQDGASVISVSTSQDYCYNNTNSTMRQSKSSNRNRRASLNLLGSGGSSDRNVTNNSSFRHRQSKQQYDHHHNNNSANNNERLGSYIHPRDMRRLVTPFSSTNEPELIVRRHVLLLNYDPLRSIVLRDRVLVIVPDGADSLLSIFENRVRYGVSSSSNDNDNIFLGSLFPIMNRKSMFQQQYQQQNHCSMQSIGSSTGDVGFPWIPNQSSSTTTTPSGFGMNNNSSSNQRPNNNNNNNNNILGSGGRSKSMRNIFSSSSGESNNKDPISPVRNNDTGARPRLNTIGSNSSSNDGIQRPTQLLANLGRSLSMRNLNPFSESNNNKDNQQDRKIRFFGKNSTMEEEDDEGTSDDDNDDDDEDEEDDDVTVWDDNDEKEWHNLPFELQCVDAVLYVIGSILSDETSMIQQTASNFLQTLLSSPNGNGLDDNRLSIIRVIKDTTNEMSARVKGYVQSIDRILDDDKLMALMNLSRLLSHPERFILPISNDIIDEESDVPELLLEANLQVGINLLNSLELIHGKIDAGSQMIDQQLDAIRNRILYANMVLSIITVCIAAASLVGSFFGMNVSNPLEDTRIGFTLIVTMTLFGMVLMLFIIFIWLVWSGTIPRKAFTQCRAV